MKKTFLSFLFGAIVIASTSVFVSCQDYNDEVNGLSEQISTNKKAFETEVATLEQQIKDLQAQHDKDVKALQDADKELKDLITEEIASVRGEATVAAQKAYDDAVKYADEAAQKAAYETLQAAKAYADQVAAAQAQKEAAAALVAANEAAQALVTEAKAKFQEAIDALEAQHAKDITDLQAEDAKIWAEINAAKTLLATASETLATASANAAQALALAQENQKALAAVKDSYNTLAASVEAQGKDIAKALTDNQAQNDKIAALNDEIAKVAKESADNYAKLVESVNAISKSVAATEKALADAQKQIDANTVAINKANADIVALSAEINALKGALADSIASVEEDIEATALLSMLLAAQAYEDAVAEAVAGDEALAAKIKDNTDAIVANLKACNDKDAALEKKINDLEKALNDKLANYATIAYVDGKFASYYTIAQVDKEIADAVEELKGLIVAKEDVEKMIEDALKGIDLSALYQNDLDVITDVHYYGAAGEVKCDYTYSYSYLPQWADTTFTGKDVKADKVILPETEKKEATVTPAYIYFLLNPTTVEHFNQMYLIDEKAAHHPYFYVGKAQKVVGDERKNLPYFNTRAQVGGNDPENVPVYKAEVTVKSEDIDWDKVVADPTYEPFATLDAELDATKQLFAPVAEYNAIRKQDGAIVKEYCYGEFAFDPTKVAVKTASVVDSTEVNCDATSKDFGFEANIENTYDLSLTFKDQPNEKIYKQIVACVEAYDGCDVADADAVKYMNALIAQFEDVLESGALKDGLAGKVDKKYDFYTFKFEYQVFDRDGDHFEYFDEVEILPEIATETATFNFTGLVPTSAAAQTTAAQNVDAKLVWNPSYKDCKTAAVEFAPANDAAKALAAGIQFELKDAKTYDAPTAAVTGTYTKAEADAVKTLDVIYDPAKLTVGTTYSYTVTVKIGDKTISISTINVEMDRPAIWFKDLQKITSTWNKEKTLTIAWAKADVRSEYSDAWYILHGSFTNLPVVAANSAEHPASEVTPMADGSTFVMNYVGVEPTTMAAVKVMPQADQTPIDYQMYVVPAAVKANALDDATEFGANNIECAYTLAYGTEAFGLENLYGKQGQFKVAFASPIYYDGYHWDFNKSAYTGGCKLVGDVPNADAAVFTVQFPEKSYRIDEANFVGSDDPSTSYYDPIKYFGTAVNLNDSADYQAWYAEREAEFITGTNGNVKNLTYQDARILKIDAQLAASVPENVKESVAKSLKINDPENIVWNDPTNEYLFEQKPTLDATGGITFKTYDKYPSLQSVPAFYYNFQVTDIWGCVKNYPFVITINPNE